MKRILFLIVILSVFSSFQSYGNEKIRVLVIDGYSNHDWEYTTLVIKSILLNSGFCTVDISTAPLNNSAEYHLWNPDFQNYNVVVQNCNSLGNGNYWPRRVQEDFEKYMMNGGGMYVFHSANNSFPEWDEYNRMIGLGWRKAEEGYALEIKEGNVIRIPPGEGERTSHGPRKDIVVEKFTDHPINKGYPEKWISPDCELYTYARGPAENLAVLSYTRDEKTKKNWPVDWIVNYGKGRIYNATFGHIWHDRRMPSGIQCVGFQTSFLRAIQWLSDKEVDYEVPGNFPNKDAVSLNPFSIVYSEEDGWTDLFNGNDLKNWEIECLPEDRNKNFWQVKDGVIECNSVGKPDHNYVWLLHEKEFEDFHLVLEFQVFKSSPGNSGIQFRSRYTSTPGTEKDLRLHGPQVDIHPPAPFRTGLIYDETFSVTRWIYPSMENWKITPDDVPKAALMTQLKYADDDPDVWNRLELICREMHITTFVNGMKVTDFDASGILDDAVHQLYNVGQKGKIGLQLHSNHELLIRFKDIKVKEYY